MAFCAFDDDGAMMGATTVSNMFLMEYMPSAPSDYVKVYLYGLLLCRYPALCDDMDKMGQMLHLDANVIKNAMSYWEREGAVVKLSDNPPSYSFVTLSAGASARDEIEESVYSNRSYIRTLQSLMPSLALENHELRIANDWLDVFGLDAETVYFMVQSYVEKKGDRLPAAKTAFKNLNDTAKEWATNGVKDVRSAREYILRSGEHYKAAQEVLKRFNKRREPTKDEIERTAEWMDKLGYALDEILAACSETVKSGDPSFAYLGGILENKKREPDDGAFESVKQLNRHLSINPKPTPEQIGAYREFIGMGFEPGAIEKAAIQCAANNRTTYDDIRRTLTKWKEIGAMTVEDIERESQEQKRYKDIMQEIFDAAGIDKKIGAGDIKTVKLWTALIEKDALLFAAEKARGTDTPLKYIDKLVKNWSAAGITTLDKAKANDLKRDNGKNPSKILSEREISDDEFKDGYYADVMNYQKAGE